MAQTQSEMRKAFNTIGRSFGAGWSWVSFFWWFGLRLAAMFLATSSVVHLTMMWWKTGSIKVDALAYIAVSLAAIRYVARRDGS